MIYEVRSKFLRKKSDACSISKQNHFYDFVLATFFILSSFPYIFPNPLIDTGIQPYALMLAFLICLIYVFRNNLIGSDDILFNMLGIGFLIAAFIALLSLVSCNVSSVLREICAYCNLFLVPAAYCILRERSTINLEPLIKICILVWVISGCLQIFIQKDLFSQILAFANTSASRGAFGLATEPSFYGIQLFYFLYLVKGFKKRKNLYYVLIFLCELLVVQSATSLIFVGSFFLAELFDSNNIVKKIFVITIVIVSSFLLLNSVVALLEQSRLLGLITQVIDNGFLALSNDQSTQGRIERIVDPLIQAVGVGFFPQGMNEKFGSAWGGALNHLGFFAVLFIVLIPLLFSRYYQTYPGKIVGFLAIFFLFFSTVQLSNPLLGILLGVSLSQSLSSIYREHRVNK